VLDLLKYKDVVFIEIIEQPWKLAQPSNDSKITIYSNHDYIKQQR